MKPQSYKRVIAYLFDILLVAFISFILTFNIYNNKTYQKQADEYINLINEYTNKEIEEDDYYQKTNDLLYDMSKDTVVITIVNVVITIVYFVVVPYFMNGQTIGKKIMKIQIVSFNDKLTMNSFLIRSLLINGVFMNILGIVFILFMEKEEFFKYNNVISNIFGVIYIISFAMILFKEDGRGLHDLLSNTKVIMKEESLM